MYKLYMFVYFIIGDYNTSANPSQSENEAQASISLPPSLFENETSATLLFTMFSSSVLLPKDNTTNENFTIGSNVIGATLLGRDIVDLNDTYINITLRLEDPVSNMNIVHSCLSNCRKYVMYDYIWSVARRSIVC